MNAKIFDHIFACYGSPLPRGSDDIIKKKTSNMIEYSTMWTLRRANIFIFFYEITIKASPPIYEEDQLHMAKTEEEEKLLLFPF